MLRFRFARGRISLAFVLTVLLAKPPVRAGRSFVRGRCPCCFVEERTESQPMRFPPTVQEVLRLRSSRAAASRIRARHGRVEGRCMRSCAWPVPGPHPGAGYRRATAWAVMDVEVRS